MLSYTIIYIGLNTCIDPTNSIAIVKFYMTRDLLPHRDFNCRYFSFIVQFGHKFGAEYKHKLLDVYFGELFRSVLYNVVCFPCICLHQKCLAYTMNGEFQFLVYVHSFWQ